MKHFVIYRKLILIIGTATAVVSVGVFFFMEDILFRTLFISFAFVFFGGLLFLLDFLHNRYNDNLLEEITLLIEALVEQQERTVFSEAEDTVKINGIRNWTEKPLTVINATISLTTELNGKELKSV